MASRLALNSLCSSDKPGTYNPPASVSQVTRTPGLKQQGKLNSTLNCLYFLSKKFLDSERKKKPPPPKNKTQTSRASMSNLTSFPFQSETAHSFLEREIPIR